MNPQTVPDRCRLVLIAPQGMYGDGFAAIVEAAVSGGDVASLILPQHGLDDASFQNMAETVVPAAQNHGVAVMLGGEGRIAARVKADGVHIDTGKAELTDAVDRLQGKMMIGAGGAMTRDDALELGELRPDYLLIGRPGHDLRPEPHPKSLALGEWWAEMIEIPCIVLAGSTPDSVAAVARIGAEFAALSAAVFAAADPAEAVRAANAALDECGVPA